MSRYCEQTRAALKGFVSENLAAKRTTREGWITHNTITVSELFLNNPDQLVLIADGTYCFIQKSANLEFQRETYSVQKKRNLIKPYVVCASDGTIVDIYGPFEATLNDAQIMIKVLETDKDLRRLIKEGDILIAERGFRDCKNSIKKDYKMEMIIPTCKYKQNCTF